jgi:hypothetical protein
MDHRAKARLLVHNGTTYQLSEAAVPELLGRGVIVSDTNDPRQFVLDPHHLMDEVEDFATRVERRAGDDARGADSPEGRRRLFAVRFAHRDGQGR